MGQHNYKEKIAYWLLGKTKLEAYDYISEVE